MTLAEVTPICCDIWFGPTVTKVFTKYCNNYMLF